MIKKNVINILSNFLYTNYFSIKYLQSNRYLLSNEEFIKNIFGKYCIKSNINMIKYIYDNSELFNLELIFPLYYSNLFFEMCSKSKSYIIEWYLDKFDKFINLSEIKYLKETMSNFDINVFNIILSKSKNFYSQKNYEDIFYYCVKNFKINFMKQIYSEYPNLNILIIDGISIYNSINIYTPRNMIYELKNILEKDYSVDITLNNTLIIKKKFYINSLQEDINIKKKFKKLDIKLDSIECILCCTSITDIISSCGHKFCSKCIKNWVIKNFSCPYCRQGLPDIKFYLLTN